MHKFVEIQTAQMDPKAAPIWLYVKIHNSYNKHFQIQFIATFRLGEYLIFDPIKIGDGGTYYCSARNEIGASDELSATFDVFHPPKGVKTIPERKAQLVKIDMSFIDDTKNLEIFDPLNHACREW